MSTDQHFAGPDDDLSGSVAILKGVSEKSCPDLFRYVKVGLVAARKATKGITEEADGEAEQAEQAAEDDGEGAWIQVVGCIRGPTHQSCPHCYKSIYCKAT